MYIYAAAVLLLLLYMGCCDAVMHCCLCSAAHAALLYTCTVNDALMLHICALYSCGGVVHADL